MGPDYNTPLSPEELPAYEAWAKAAGKNPASEEQDYDLRGLYKSGATLEPGAHSTDLFKKPSHPTFSTQSQYHGVDGNEGGTWGLTPDGKDSFTPGRTNLEHWGAQNLQNYFDTFEKGNRLLLPGQ